MAEPGTDGYVVITGGPGAGKSTLIDALAAKGFARTDEAGRAIIQDRLAIGATGWSDPELFAELMLSWELRSHRQAAGSRGPVFFDRGVPDLVGYFRLIGRPLPAHVHEAALRFRYHRVVFAAPPWREIYVHDAERTQSWEEAVRTHDAVTWAYTEHGYEVVALPPVPVADRVAFVLDALGCGA
ncbi:AAA family ATPase [Nonomuraea sp. NBC_01738]|uniref:AAA family ATPase n=1 Tax=Nonomuraea sp. NBC_01738 TaxID=2976003 RepID=UPI002E14EE97|nr:AAA family ATPase [Nonomuraea sp. NBC_01738]